MWSIFQRFWDPRIPMFYNFVKEIFKKLIFKKFNVKNEGRVAIFKVKIRKTRFCIVFQLLFPKSKKKNADSPPLQRLGGW